MKAMGSLASSRWIQVMKELIKRFQENEVTALAAQMTYYLIISFFPFLIFLITLISYTPLLDIQALEGLARFLPQEAYQLVQGILSEVLASRSLTLLSFGMVTTLWTASNGVLALIRGINKAKGIRESRSFLKLRVLALIFTIGLILLMVAVLLVLVLGKPLALYLSHLLGGSTHFLTIWALIRHGVALLVMVLCFSLLYAYGPNGTLPFRGVIGGAVVAALGWTAISYGFSYYVNHFGSFTRMYGSIGGIFILLLWLYISSIILLLGAEVNHVLLSLPTKKASMKPAKEIH